MKNFFSWKDFNDVCQYTQMAQDASTVANAKLNALISSWPFVYSKLGEAFPKWHLVTFEGASHKARLAFVEEIAKEPCNHDPEIILGDEGLKVSWPTPLQPNIYQQIFIKVKCKHCGKELQTTWSEK